MTDDMFDAECDLCGRDAGDWTLVDGVLYCDDCLQPEGVVF